MIRLVQAAQFCTGGEYVDYNPKKKEEKKTHRETDCGYDCAAIYEDNRKLVFENPERGVRYLLVKPSDVAIYVEHGAADIGVVGKV